MSTVKEVESLVKRFSDIEQEARILDRVDHCIEAANEKLAEMESYALPDLKNKFGVTFKKALLVKMRFNGKDLPQDLTPEEAAIEIKENKNGINKRLLFKITQLQEDTFKAFVSFPNPRGKTYGECFIIQVVEGELKIVAMYFLSNRGGAAYSWNYAAGKRDFSFGKEKPLSLTKFEVPADHEESLAYHQQDSL